MFTRRFAPLAVALWMGLSGCPVPDDGGGGGGGGGDGTGGSWTVLVYVVADNDLEPFALQDLAEMAAVGSTSNFRFVAQVDRSPGYSADGIGNLSDWTSAKRLVVRSGGFDEAADLGEIDMADPAELAEFVRWGIQSFPADRFALVLWNHGAAWPGFGLDEDLGQKLSLAQMQAAIATGLQQSGRARLDIVGFDACLMATYEVAAALAPHADYLLASEELEPGHGWDWTGFAAARNSPGMAAGDLGKAVINAYRPHAVQNDTAEAITLSLIDLGKIQVLHDAVGALALEAQENVSVNAIEVARGLDAALGFARAPDPAQSSHMVDLGDLAARLSAANPRFAGAKQAVDAALTQAVVHQTRGTVTASATGISIYFPPLSAYYDPNYDALQGIAAWRGFLKAFYGGSGSTGPAPQFTNPGKVASAAFSGGGLVVGGTLAAGASQQIATSTLLYGFRDLDQNLLFVFGDAPAAFDAANVQAAWDLTVLVASQGTSSAFAYLSVSAVGAGNWAAAIPFAYVASPGAGEEYAIRQIVFDSADQLLQDKIYLVTDQGVGELTPQAGSTLRPIVQYIDSAGNSGWAYGGPALSATSPIALSSVSAGQGDTVFGALYIANAAGEGDAVIGLAVVP